MNDFNERVANLSAEKRALLEAHLRGGEGIAERAIPRRPEFAPAPLSFAQQRMWFMDQLQPGNPAYNRPTHIHLRGALNIAVLENSLNEIVRRHEILRTSFLATDGQPVQAVASSVTLSLPVADLGSLPAHEQQAEVSRIVTEEAQHAFDLSRVPLLKVKLVRFGETEHLLVLTLHHIVFDGWSAGILIRELSTLYKALSAGGQPTLPALPIQVGDFAKNAPGSADVSRATPGPWEAYVANQMQCFVLGGFPIDRVQEGEPFSHHNTAPAHAQGRQIQSDDVFELLDRVRVAARDLEVSTKCGFSLQRRYERLIPGKVRYAQLLQHKEYEIASALECGP